MNILGVIPARGGSKGIPRKNLKILRGKPLIAYMFEAASDSRLISKLIVSTEDREISNTAKKYGIDVPFMRPKKLSADHVSLIPVLRHALEFFNKKKYFPDIVVSLQPTSPLVTPEDIDSVLRLMCDTGCDSAFTVKNVEECHPERMYGLENDKLMLKSYTSESPLQRQDREPVYKLTGAVIARKSVLLARWSSMDSAFGNDRRAVLVPWYRGIDINQPLDLIVAKAIMDNYDWQK